MKLLFLNKTPIIISYTLCSWVAKLYGFPRVAAMALFPFIIVRDNTILNSPDIINHESIHIRQYLETLIIGLLIVGLLQYLYAFFVLKKRGFQAYYYMSHEQEAHQNDSNLNYLKERKLFSYYKYLLPKNKKKMNFVDGKRIIYE